MGLSHYEGTSNTFVLHALPNMPLWRSPQLGALSAITSHWILDEQEPALVSMPTGSGKTAVALALPYLCRSHRVLVVVPSTELRSQIARAFRSGKTLRDIGALTGTTNPVVHEIKGRSTKWEEIRNVDVVVAHPNSISPIHLDAESVPPADFFDLIIVDEAHHSPARTWKAILDHFGGSKAVLLTATPRRRDGKSLPGKAVFYFPLRRAISEGIYKPVVPRLLNLGSRPTRPRNDLLIATECVKISALPEHATSAIIIRASSIARADLLQKLYKKLGLDAKVVHSRMPATTKDQTLTEWRSGQLKAVVVVDMLGEGIDLPNLRIVAYHDKHKSTQATIQLIGRLARVNPDHLQDSILVTVLDNDIYPSLVDVVKVLYEEDADWSKILPGLIDDEIEKERLNQEYVGKFESPPPNVSLKAIAPLARVLIYERRMSERYTPSFVLGDIPAEVQKGGRIGGQTILYSGLNETKTTWIILTMKVESPRWYISDVGLAAPTYDLHIFSWHKGNQVRFPDLLFVNTSNMQISREIREILDPGKQLRLGNPLALQAAFDSHDRSSVSSVGVRNTYVGTQGAPTYAMFSGSGVDRGLSEADTNSRALGHAMAQVKLNSGSTTVGFAASKLKYWETRYMSLREYEIFIMELADRYWSPPSSTLGPLLPTVARGVRTEAFPQSKVFTVEMNPRLVGQGWKYQLDQPLEFLDIDIDPSIAPSGTSIPLMVTDLRKPKTILWRGFQDLDGNFTTTSVAFPVQRGFVGQSDIGQLFDREPPNIYFVDGCVVHGGTTYLPVEPKYTLPPISFTSWDWSGTDIQKESKTTGRSDTIHDRVERELTKGRPRKAWRWVLCNDGSGEIADHIVIEIDTMGMPKVEFWHSKFAKTGSSSVRVTDFEVLAQQAVKSRVYFTDGDFWKRLGRRLNGQESPRLRFVSGNSLVTLRMFCGLIPHRKMWSLADNPRIIDGKIVLVQPGLTISGLRGQLDSRPVPISANQVKELLTIVHNSIQRIASVELISDS